MYRSSRWTPECDISRGPECTYINLFHKMFAGPGPVFRIYSDRDATLACHRLSYAKLLHDLYPHRPSQRPRGSTGDEVNSVTWYKWCHWHHFKWRILASSLASQRASDARSRSIRDMISVPSIQFEARSKYKIPQYHTSIEDQIPLG